LSTLQRISIDYGSAYHSLNLASQLKLYLSSYVIHLEIRNLGLSGVRFRSSAINMPNLKRLALYNSANFLPIDAPNLSSLTLTKNSSLENGLDASPGNIYPCLQTLIVSTSEIKTMQFIQAPLVHTFELRCAGSIEQKDETYSLLDSVLNSSHINPVIFRLRDSVLRPSIIIEMIRRMARLEELELCGVLVKEQFFKAFSTPSIPLGPQFQDSQPTLPCPSLKGLSIDYSDLQRHSDLRPTRLAALKAIKSRHSIGNVLHQASMRTTKEKGWFSLLP
jgi:hypothetical protein